MEDTKSSPGNQDTTDCSARKRSGSRGEIRNHRRVAEEEARKARKGAFDAQLKGRVGIVAPGVENVVLVNFFEPKMTMGGDAEGNRWGM
ncbi:hypothetical protein FF1_043394 [Malus domestica]